MKQSYTYDSMLAALGIMERQIKGNGLLYYEILGLGRGGRPLAVELSHRCTMKFNCLHFASSKGKGGEAPDFLLDELAHLSGKQVLIVDDVCDKGHTLKEVMDCLKRFGAQNVATCTWFYKKNEIHKPDIFVTEVDPEIWVDFPWEI